MYKIKTLLKRILPKVLVSFFSKIKTLIGFNYWYEYYLIATSQKRYQSALNILRDKDKISVAFFLIHEPVWKYDRLYWLLEKDELFEPLIIVCPYTTYGNEIMKSEMHKAYEKFSQKGYNIISSYSEIKNDWIDVKNEINPDIVFFTNPWKITKDFYYIFKFKDTLTCYVPYFFNVTKHLKENYGGVLQNLCWKVYYETNIHLNLSRIYSRNNASNVVVSGYPGIDSLFKSNKPKKDPWMQNKPILKRIIWAPHHSIEGQDSGLRFSNFHKYSQYFLDIAQEYNSKIQIAFKPHPLLKPKLYLDPTWGKQRTEDYYRKWSELENGILSEGDYEDLFLTSDALIHDCGSFMVEYLATSKPCLYTIHDSDVRERLNEFGQMALKEHYLASDHKKILEFIEKIVLEEKDTLRNSREKFINNYLIAPNNQYASDYIFKDLKKSIKKNTYN